MRRRLQLFYYEPLFTLHLLFSVQRFLAPLFHPYHRVPRLPEPQNPKNTSPEGDREETGSPDSAQPVGSPRARYPTVFVCGSAPKNPRETPVE